ncbi:MAG: alpha-ribazole phosphatase family protein [Bacteroidota bacterium]
MTYRSFYLVRHTRPDVEKGLIYGQTDLDVTDTFQEEAREVASVLTSEGELPVYSSPLQRCHKLADYLCNTDPQTDDRIKEMNFGDWEMKSWMDLDRSVIGHWIQNIETLAPPGGESNSDLKSRSLDFWKELVAKPGEGALIVSHYGVIISLLSHFLDISIQKAFRMDLNYGTVIRVRIFEDQRYKILFLK